MSESFGEKVRREAAALRIKADAAWDAGDFEAALRVPLDHCLSSIPGDLKLLREHGYEVEGGSYLLGSILTSLMMQELDPKDAIHHPLLGQLIREYMERAKSL